MYPKTAVRRIFFFPFQTANVVYSERKIQLSGISHPLRGGSLKISVNNINERWVERSLETRVVCCLQIRVLSSGVQLLVLAEHLC
jgi:hypothetical protein